MEVSLNEKFGISSRVQLRQITDKHIGIVKLIKSRIIQKDALKIIELATLVKDVDDSLDVSLICNDNICSKSITLLQQNNIQIQFISHT